MERIEIDLAQRWSKGLTICFENAASSAALNMDDFTHVKQVHGKEIAGVEPAHATWTKPIAEADGLYVAGGQLKDYPKPLAIKTADCVPLFFVDPNSEFVAAVHAGWRGLAQGIHRIVFERRWADPKTTWVWVGPSLNGNNFEVGRDVWSLFRGYENDRRIFAPAPDPEKRFFFVWEYLRAEMDKLGVELVYNSEVDTFADTDFASYRRAKKEGRELGGTRNLSWIGFQRPGATR